MRRVIIIIVLISLLFTACVTPDNPNQESKVQLPTEGAAESAFYSHFLEQYANSIYSSVKLSSGGILIVRNGDENSNSPFYGPHQFEGKNLYRYLARVDVWQENGTLQNDVNVFPWADEGIIDADMATDCEPTWIFYDEESWQSKYEDPSYVLEHEDELHDTFLNFSYFDSHYFFLDGRLGRDLIVIVTPAMKLYLPPYKKCPQYGIEPYDSLGTTPMKVIDESSADQYLELWHAGYPIWVFAIPEQWITDDYELHYGDYVLTGKDIKAGTYDSMGVTPPERRGYHIYTLPQE